MYFCPNCQKDFKEKTLCPDCQGELLEGSFEDFQLLFSSQKEELILTIYNLLCERNFSSVQYDCEKSGLYRLYVSKEENDYVVQAIYDFAEENKLPLTESEKEDLFFTLSGDTFDEADESAAAYIPARERYEDLFSSASSLLFVGALGILFEVLVYLKVIPLNMNLLFYILSSFLFLSFVLAGILSFAKAVKVKSSISAEDTDEENIRNYYLSEYKFETETEASPEELYYIRTDDMKQKGLEKFPGTDPLFLDSVIEEVYQTLFQE